MRKRKPPCKSALAHPRQTYSFGRLRTAPIAIGPHVSRDVVGSLKRAAQLAFQHPKCRFAFVFLRPQRKETEIRLIPSVRVVEYLPIDQSSCARKADAARADSTHRKGNAIKKVTFV